MSYIFTVLIFKLKDQIEVDKLIDKQHFEFKRTHKKNGKLEVTKIFCKIKGLRSDSLKEYPARF